MMQTNSAFCAYEDFDDEVYTVYEDPANSLSDEFYDYYGTPQMPAYPCGSPFDDYQVYSYDTYHYDYNAVYYLQPTYLIYCPVIQVQYSAAYTYYPCFEYVPVYFQDYVYNYCPPTTPYYVNDTACIYPAPVCDPFVPSPVEPNVFATEEYAFDLYNVEKGYSNDKYERFAEKVGEEITTCYLFYEEYPEKLNGGPVDDEEKRMTSDKRLENGTVSSVPGVDGSETVRLDDRESSRSVEMNFWEEGADENFIEKAPSFQMLQGKADTSKSIYSVYFKNDESKKSFDLKEYYFNDTDWLRIPKPEIRYEDESEKHILYVLLASLKMSILKQYMNENYDKKKKKLYRKACKGIRKKKKKLKKLKWRRHRLGSIREEEEPETLSAEMECEETLKNDVQNVGLKGYSKTNDLTDVEKQLPFATTSLRDELEVASVEERVLMVETQPSAVSSGAAENNSKDLGPKKTEVSSTEEAMNGGSVIRVGDVEIRYTPDRYRYFCLQKSRETRWTPVRKFFSRMWRYVKKPT